LDSEEIPQKKGGEKDEEDMDRHRLTLILG